MKHTRTRLFRLHLFNVFGYIFPECSCSIVKNHWQSNEWLFRCQSSIIQLSWNGTYFKFTCGKTMDCLWVARQQQAEVKEGWDPLTQLQEPTVPASIPHNYTGPQIERHFSLLPDPFLFSFLCHSVAVCKDMQSIGAGWGYLDVRKGNLSET